jgi:N2-acetyl-L-2,4-diaminobutanoate deacetylase
MIAAIELSSTEPMTEPRSNVRATIDLDAGGKRFGALLVPDSRNEGGWSHLVVPIVVVANGPGETALLLGGNHGDEYEGQFAMRNLALELEPKAVRGRVIVIPCLSIEASRAGTRLWPSGANFNRVFPGAPNGSPDQQLADYLTRVLFPQADIVVDLHSGGRSIRFHPMTTMTDGPMDEPRRERMLGAMLAWGADFHLVAGVVGSGPGLLPAEAERQGKVVLTSELGGGGSATTGTLRVAEDGLRNALRHLGVLDGEVVSRASRGLPETVVLRGTNLDGYVFAPASGLFEPAVEPPEQVIAGQLLGRLHWHEHPNRPPEDIVTPIDGVVAAVRVMPSTRAGDVLAVVTEPA